MRTVYAIQVEIGGEPAVAFESIVGRLTAWPTNKYRDRWDTELDIPAEGGEVSPLEAHTLRTQRLRPDAGEFFSLEWSHPDETDPTLRWTSVCQVARSAEQVQMQMSLRVASAAFEVRPVRFQFGRPGVITQILKQLRCTVRGAPVRTAPRTLGTEFVADFVRDELLDRARALPVVVLSPDETGNPPVDPTTLQEWTLGLAHVVVLQDKWAGYKLTNALGKELSCFHGYGRLYWPGLEPGTDPRRFPLYAPATLQWVDRIGRDFPRRLFEQLAAVASVRMVEGQVIRDIREAAEAERAASLEALRKGRAAQADYDELLELADEEIKELRAAKRDLRARVDDLQDQLATAQANLEATWRDSGGEEEEEPAAGGPETRPALSSIRDALDAAEADFGDVLRIYASAQEAASASGFARPEEVYEALGEIADLGRAYFGSDDRKVGPWDQQFSVKYAHTESQTTKTKFGGHRVFRLGDGSQTQKQMFKHLTLGGGDKVNCLQIYFEPDEEAGTMDIGYCGEHLPYAKQRT